MSQTLESWGPETHTSAVQQRRGPVHPFSIAPMMERTDRHFRALFRRISRNALQYSEMVTTPALLHGDPQKHLQMATQEGPTALQLGGDSPEDLALCAKLGVEWGYAEINLNVGCPSSRVQRGRIGACLMADPGRVADCVQAMREAVRVPITVKHRIGIDEADHYEDLVQFASTVSQTHCDRFIIHARKAWLHGLSPKQNRTIPPLRYDLVHRLKRDYPHLTIEINGGITNLEECRYHLDHVDGVMVGRAAWNDPFGFVEVDRALYGETSVPPTRHEIIRGWLPHVEQERARGTRLGWMVGGLYGMFRGCSGARAFRQAIAGAAGDPHAGATEIEAALRLVPEDDGSNPRDVQPHSAVSSAPRQSFVIDS